MWVKRDKPWGWSSRGGNRKQTHKYKYIFVFKLQILISYEANTLGELENLLEMGRQGGLSAEGTVKLSGAG